MTKRLLMFLCLGMLPAIAFAQSYSALLTGDGTGVAVVTIEGSAIRYSVLAQRIGVATEAAITLGEDAAVNLDVNTLGNGRVENIAQSVLDAIRGNPAGHAVEVRGTQGEVSGPLVQPVAAGARTQYVPVVGKVQGGGGTNFVTDVRILNHGASTATVTLEYFQQSPSGQTAPTATSTQSIAPGEQKVLDDVIGILNTTGLGGLRVTSTENVEVRARVINDLRFDSQGTTGFAVEAGEMNDAGTSGTLGFLSAASPSDFNAQVGFRTNVGYFNPNATPVTATFTVRANDGAALGTKTITIPGYGFVQQPAFGLIDTVPATDQVQSNFYLSWSSDAPLFVYAAVVDNKTGDSVLVQ